MTYSYKLFSIAILFAGVLISCGGNGSSNGNLDALRAKKDSLKQMKKLVAKELSELEIQIKKADTNGNHNVPLVSTMSLNPTNFKHYFQVQGLVETDQNASINAETSAKIKEIYVQEGAKVRKGQVLIKLDGRIIENNLAELKTQIDLAKTVYDKQKSLWDQNIGSELQYLEAKQRLESLERRSETLQTQLEMYIIKAPFEGMVDEVYPKVGEMATPMSPMLRIINTDHVYIKSDVSERYLGKIKVGDTSIIEFQSMNKQFPSAITRIGNYINPNNRSFKVRFDFSSESFDVKPNLLAKIDILDYQKKNAIVVPTKIIQENPNGDEFVYVLSKDDTNSAKKIMIKTGMAYQGNVEVKEGLSAGDIVIIQGGRSIKDGDLVQITQN